MEATQGIKTTMGATLASRDQSKMSTVDSTQVTMINLGA
jgi:hypothetical protein